jgi:hypothetical protein
VTGVGQFRIWWRALPVLLAGLSLAGGGRAADAAVDLGTFAQLLHQDAARRGEALRRIEAAWEPGFLAPLVEVAILTGDESIAPVLDRRAGRSLADDWPGWLELAWSRPYRPPAFYAEFKAALYGLIDPRFREYFVNTARATIRLDEIRWGGVRRDGIPPLDHPKVVAAAAATYLRDSHVVFGLVHGGESRAYPKRILAWHEMVKDRVGGVELNGVYCTLCGTMIVYRPQAGGRHHELGTSGFLYRSNKLMYDHATKSLWSTLAGEPVVGPLVGTGLVLESLPVVTTTWGEWRRRHPDTKVLALETGHTRDYAEGAAYRDYFATDELMFNVPQLDRRLDNKDEVLALRFGGPGDPPTALDLRMLKRRPVYQDRLGSRDYVVVTDRTGANRVYASEGRRFQSVAPDRLRDEKDVEWRISESALHSDGGGELPRLPAHRAFWFGWYSAHPDTRLVR